MKAIKENREYTITEDVIESFVNEGYDIIDETTGRVIAYGKGHTISFEKYLALADAYEKLEGENAELRKEIGKLKAKKKKGE